jgi:hypothetical protein
MEKICSKWTELESLLKDLNTLNHVVQVKCNKGEELEPELVEKFENGDLKSLLKKT